MKMKKVAVKIAAFLVIVGSMATTASALQPQGAQSIISGDAIITPYWVDIAEISPMLDADGTTLYPEVSVTAETSSSKIKGTMYLEKYSSGRWKTAKSWNFSGTGSVFVSKSYSGVSGTKYRTRVSVTIGSETAQATSDSCNI